MATFVVLVKPGLQSPSSAAVPRDHFYCFPGFQCDSYSQVDLTPPILILTTLRSLSLCVTTILSSGNYWSKPPSRGLRKDQREKSESQLQSSRCLRSYVLEYSQVGLLQQKGNTSLCLFRQTIKFFTGAHSFLITSV